MEKKTLTIAGGGTPILVVRPDKDHSKCEFQPAITLGARVHKSNGSADNIELIERISRQVQADQPISTLVRSVLKMNRLDNANIRDYYRQLTISPRMTHSLEIRKVLLNKKTRDGVSEAYVIGVHFNSDGGENSRGSYVVIGVFDLAAVDEALAPAK